MREHEILFKDAKRRAEENAQRLAELLSPGKEGDE
jgi:hypothetical protein